MSNKLIRLNGQVLIPVSIDMQNQLRISSSSNNNESFQENCVVIDDQRIKLSQISYNIVNQEAEQSTTTVTSNQQNNVLIITQKPLEEENESQHNWTFLGASGENCTCQLDPLGLRLRNRSSNNFLYITPKMKGSKVNGTSYKRPCINIEQPAFRGGVFLENSWIGSCIGWDLPTTGNLHPGQLYFKLATKPTGYDNPDNHDYDNFKSVLAGNVNTYFLGATEGEA